MAYTSSIGGASFVDSKPSPVTSEHLSCANQDVDNDNQLSPTIELSASSLFNFGAEEARPTAASGAYNQNTRIRGVLVLPGAWAMGEGLVVDGDEFAMCKEVGSYAANPKTFHGSLSRMACTVGSYFAGLANAFVDDKRTSQSYLDDECTADPDFCSCIVSVPPGTRRGSKSFVQAPIGRKNKKID